MPAFIWDFGRLQELSCYRPSYRKILIFKGFVQNHTVKNLTKSAQNSTLNSPQTLRNIGFVRYHSTMFGAF